jgi:hypothetical protein
VASPDGLLIIDYGAMGRPVGVEITGPQSVPLERLNQLLADLSEAPLAEQHYKPVRAAQDRSALLSEELPPTTQAEYALHSVSIESLAGIHPVAVFGINDRAAVGVILCAK